MISIDQQSPIASIDRAIGHVAFAKPVRFAIAILQASNLQGVKQKVRKQIVSSGCIMRPQALNRHLVSKRNQTEPGEYP
jgi:hypothetical protein